MAKANAYNPNAPDYISVHRYRRGFSGTDDYRKPIFEPAEQRTPHAGGKPGVDWIVRLPGDGAIACSVKAQTKSEARSLAKEKLGLATRLPVGTVCRKAV